MDFMNAAARRKFDLPEGWQYKKWERNGDYIILIGAVYHIKTRGRYKGKPNYQKPTTPVQKVIIPASAIDEERTIYERETGNCSTCLGSGREWAGWSIQEGTRYRKCTRCGGSGKVDTDETGKD